MSRGALKSLRTLPPSLPSFGVQVEIFARRLKEFRERKGLNQVQVAQHIGVGPRVYNRWERGGAVPRLDTLIKLADLLEVSLDELAGRVEPHAAEFRARNPKLHKLYQQLEGLSQEEQQAAAVLLDSLVKRSAMSRVLAG